MAGAAIVSNNNGGRSTSAERLTVSCAAGQIVLGGGGSASTELRGSFPSNSTGSGVTTGQASSWTITWDSNSNQSGTVYAICAAR